MDQGKKTSLLKWQGVLVVTAFVLIAFIAAAAQVTIRIDARRVENNISALLYGQFSEFMFEGMKGGLSAELIRDRGFETSPNSLGLPRYWERDPDDRNDDDAMHFLWDNSVFYPVRVGPESQREQHSLAIQIKYEDGQRRGIRQGGMPISKGQTYIGHFWLKTSAYQGSITVALEADQTGGERYASADITELGGDWARYEFRLTSQKSDPLAKMAILFHGHGQLWLDQVSLMSADAVDGIRRDVEQRIAAAHPAFIRWPGGNVAQDYRWMWGIGPRDQRPQWVNLSWRNELEPSDIGTDEYVKLCRRVHAEPAITVNIQGRGATADEAAGWVEYANGPATSKYGAMRAGNHNLQPFNVKYWEIGNEIWGSWVRGHSDARTYAENLVRYVEKMKAVDPTIKIIACGNNDMDWNRTVLRIAGRHIDYLAIHHYYGAADMKGDTLNLMARPLFYERFYRQVQQVIRELVPARDIKLAINEWNTTLHMPAQQSMTSALYGARLMNVFERTGDFVGMTAMSDLVNGWLGGGIQASRHGVFVTPTYLANTLYASRLGTERLFTDVTGPTFSSTLEGKNVPFVDAVVSRSSDGREIYIKAVNTHPDLSISAQIELKGVEVGLSARLETLNGPTVDTVNDFNNTNRVNVVSSQIASGDSFTVTLPEHSVSVITLKARN